MDESWYTLTLDEQIGNIGSEFSRMLTAQEQGDGKRLLAARQRAIELLDLTLSDERRSNLEKKELSKVRELVPQISAGSDSPATTSIQELVNYCLPFAIAARSGKG